MIFVYSRFVLGTVSNSSDCFFLPYLNYHYNYFSLQHYYHYTLVLLDIIYFFLVGDDKNSVFMCHPEYLLTFSVDN